MKKEISAEKIWKWVKEDLVVQKNLFVGERACFLAVNKIKRDLLKVGKDTVEIPIRGILDTKTKKIKWLKN